MMQFLFRLLFPLANDYKNNKARIFLLVDLREIFFRFRVGGTRKKKALKMTSQLVIFRAFFFLISPEQTLKIVK